MLRRWLQRADQTKGVGPTLWAYLWWGLLVRITLLVAMGTLLVVEGNFLAEWLFASRIAPAADANIEDYTMVSYAGLSTFLTMGAYVRWTLLRRLKVVQTAPDGASPPVTPASPDEAADATSAAQLVLTAAGAGHAHETQTASRPRTPDTR